MSKAKVITSQAKVFAISAKLAHLANYLAIQPASPKSVDFAGDPVYLPASQQSVDFPANQSTSL